MTYSSNCVTISRGEGTLLNNCLLVPRRRRLEIDERMAADPAAGLYLVNTRSADVELAAAGSTGRSGDWINEIHLTPQGYRKCTVLWADVIDPLFA